MEDGDSDRGTETDISTPASSTLSGRQDDEQNDFRHTGKDEMNGFCHVIFVILVT